MTIDELASLLLEPGPPVTADDVARFARRFDLFAPAALCTLLETRNGGHLSSFVTHGDFTLKSIFGLRDDDDILSLRAWFESPTLDPDQPPSPLVRESPPAPPPPRPPRLVRESFLAPPPQEAPSCGRSDVRPGSPAHRPLRPEPARCRAGTLHQRRPRRPHLVRFILRARRPPLQ